MNIVFVVLLAVTAVLQLFACARKCSRLRTATKILLMPLLIACYLTWGRSFSLFVLAAMLFGWLGDVLLLGTKRQLLFICGAVSFCVGHFFYMHEIFSVYVGTVGFPLLLLVLVLIALPAMLTFALRKELNGQPSLRVPMPLYFCVLTGLCVLSAFALCTMPGIAPALLLLGSVFFLLSDSILSVLVLKKGQGAGCGNFWVMFTYILAQSLLAAAFCI